MFSLDIVDTDAFLDMPQTSQLLYFHLAMRADDEGFIGNPKRIMRMIGAGDDDIKVLITKKFIIPFESGVCVIKHWLIHNTIRMDRFHSTNYTEEKNNLILKDNKAYKLIEITDGCQVVAKLATQVKLSKDNISKDKIDVPSIPFNDFWSIYPKKVGKGNTEKLWKNLSLEVKSKILDDIPRRQYDDKWLNGFIKDPERYIKSRQWEDELIPSKSKLNIYRNKTETNIIEKLKAKTISNE